MDAQPGGPDRQPYDAYTHGAADEPQDDVPPPYRPPGAAWNDRPSPAPATWVPPEPLDSGARPAWMPPGSRPGQAYGPPPPGWPQPPMPPPYGAQPPYGGQPPYGAPGRPSKPRMPRWAKVVMVIGVAGYVLSLIGQIINLLVIKH